MRAGHVFVIAILGALTASCRRTPATPPVTFNRDIAPILFEHCSSCHRPGEAAPFSLLTYADAAKRAGKIADATRARHMPPWLPDRTDFPIAGERRLTDPQIDLISRWAAASAPEGNAADLPPAPQWPDGWQLGRPDVVIAPEKPFLAGTPKEDVYRNLVLRAPLTSSAYVRAVEFKTNGAPVHHAVIRVDTTGESRRRDGQDGRPGFDGMMWDNAQDPEGHFIGWAPGRGPIVSPEGMPWRLDAGADLVVELHMIPSRTPLVIAPTVGLFLTNTPPARTPLTLKMGSKSIDIPAGKSDYVVTDIYELPVAAELMSVYPHAHYLAKDMRVSAALPDGSVKTLLHIPHWSFHWQQDYRYVTPIPLPRGTRVTMTYTYDNSRQNEHNPSDPPVRVKVGPKSTDEMAELGLQVLTASIADAATLVQSFADRDAQANVLMAEQRVRDEPNVAETRAFLGGSYVEVGRYTDAIPHLTTALKLDDRLSGAHADLGTALMAEGRIAEALVHFERAAALTPKDEGILFNLGNGLKAAGRQADAAAAYTRALAINPDFPDAHVNLGALLFAAGRTAEALPHFERAVSLRPNSAVIHTNYASVLAASGRFPEALRHTRRALELNPSYPPALENLTRLERIGARIPNP
jgi:tetratricopeptide (TPR) repeat protein/mono/diheme cytochrome c family protein